jgi:hypothetical protein
MWSVQIAGDLGGRNGSGALQPAPGRVTGIDVPPLDFSRAAGLAGRDNDGGEGPAAPDEDVDHNGRFERAAGRLLEGRLDGGKRLRYSARRHGGAFAPRAYSNSSQLR